MNSSKKVKKSRQASSDNLSEGDEMPARSSSSASTASDTSSPAGANSLTRQQRNLAEKHRRDKLNNYISELASLVPFVSLSSKKLDKTSILRLSAAHLRLHHSPLNPNKFKKISWKPNELDTDHLSELFKAVDGFLVVATQLGKIMFTSKSSESYLGLQDIEMIGHSLFSFIHPADVSHAKEELEKLVASAEIKSSENRCTFCARMRERSQPRSEVVTYQMMHFYCRFDLYKDAESENRQVVSFFRLKKSQGSSAKCNGLLKIFLKPVNINPVDELTITEAFQEEYVTKHGVDGKILFADHRISTITGHLPHEVIGMLAYDYIFPEDVPVAHFAQKLMFSSSNGMGMIVYRLRARDCSSVYLKTVGHLQYDKGSTMVSHFVCINKLLSEEEGEEELKKFTDRYSPHIKEILALSHSGSNVGDSNHIEGYSVSSGVQQLLSKTDSSTLPCLPSPCCTDLPSLPLLTDYSASDTSAISIDSDTDTPSDGPATKVVSQSPEKQQVLVNESLNSQCVTCQACVRSPPVHTICRSHNTKSADIITKKRSEHLHSRTFNGSSQMPLNGRKRSSSVVYENGVPFENGVVVSKRQCFNLPSAEKEHTANRLSPVQTDVVNAPVVPEVQVRQGFKSETGLCGSQYSPLQQVTVTSLCHGNSRTIRAQYTAAISHHSSHLCSCSDHYTCPTCQNSSHGFSPHNINNGRNLVASSMYDECMYGNGDYWLLNQSKDNHFKGQL